MKKDRRMVAMLAAFLMLAVGFTACGSDDDGGSSGSGSAKAGDTASGSDTAGGGEEEVRSALLAIQDAYYAADGKAWCAGLSRRGVAESAKQAKALKAGNSCPDAVAVLVPQPIPAAEAKKFKARILGIKVNGDKAVVTSEQGNKGRTDKVPFIREQGEWKMDIGLALTAQ